MTVSTFETVPEIVMGWKFFTCPTCQASIQAYVDIYAGCREEIPAPMELHLEWHDRNDR